MTGPRFRRLLAIIVLAVVVLRSVRVLRGNPTRAFDRTTDRPTPPPRPVVDQQSPPEVDLAATPSVNPSDELPFAPPVAKRPAPAVEISTASAVTTTAPTADVDPTATTSPTAVLSEAVASPGWVAPVGGSCPEGYPVKAKLGSGIFHLPGMSAYERTTPDRCYRDGDAAVADGLRVAKR